MEMLSKAELKRLGKLSGLDLSEEEELVFLKDLQAILEYVDKINKVPAFEAVGSHKNINVFREDKVRPSEAFDIINNAPVKKDHCFVVPKVLKH